MESILSQLQRPPVDSGPGLGHWLRRWRTARDLTQGALAERAAISPSYLSDIERGRVSTPSLGCLSRLATALGVERGELLRAAGLLESGPRFDDATGERRLVAVYRALEAEHRESVQRFARFLLNEQQHWAQAQLELDDQVAPSAQTGPPLFDLDAY
jgi:transcriptional regulator with XRE-family HTH domain